MRFPLVKFKDIATVVTGSTPKKIDGNYNGSIPFVTPGDLGIEPEVKSARANLTMLGAESGRLLPRNSVLVCCIGATIGKVGIAKVPVVTNQQINSLIFNEKDVEPKYGYYFCSSLTELLRHKSTSTTMPIINKTSFSEIAIPLPHLADQRKIAEILDAADALRQKDRQLINHYTALSQSLFLDMFGDPVTNSKGYDQKTLLELTDKITDGTHHTPTYTQTGVPFLRVTDVTESNDSKKFISKEEHQVLIKRCHPVRGDILYTKNGTIGVGKIVDWDFDFSIFVSLCLLKPKHEIIEVKYLNYFLNTPFAIRQAMKHSKEATIKNLHLVEIKKMKVPYPTLEKQKDFVFKLEEIEKQKQQAEASLVQSNNLFNSLLQKAFTGELTQQSERAA